METYMVYKLLLIHILTEKCPDWSKITIFLICTNKKNKKIKSFEHSSFCIHHSGSFTNINLLLLT